MLQSHEVLESSIIASAVIHLVTSRNNEDWAGTPTLLLSELENEAELLKINTRTKSWPKSPSIVSRRLKEIKINLRQVGIEIEFVHDGTQMIIIIRKMPLVPLMLLVDKKQA